MQAARYRLSFAGGLARRLDEYVHLLSDEEGYVPVTEPEDRLKDPSVYSFRIFTKIAFSDQPTRYDAFPGRDGI
jgi:hypothetical protein